MPCVEDLQNSCCRNKGFYPEQAAEFMYMYLEKRMGMLEKANHMNGLPCKYLGECEVKISGKLAKVTHKITAEVIWLKKESYSF